MSASCDTCKNYIFDEDSESYLCDAQLDEDELYSFLSGGCKDCPYYRSDDDYEIVKKQN